MDGNVTATESKNSSDPEAPRARPRKTALVPLALLVLAVAIAGGLYWYNSTSSKGAPAAASAPAALPVTVAKPVVKEITEWDEFTGRFEAVESVEVRARVNGYLAAVHFADGAIV